jgi:class 3 adenylate cyclase
MTFLESVRRARAYLEEQRRVSLRALRFEFGLDAEQLDALVEELVDVQGVATREGKELAWAVPAQAAATTAEAGPALAAAPPPAAQVERRHLTVLFCDLVGSAPLAAALDDEEFSDLVRRYQARSRQVIDNYEGHLARSVGDGLLVYFGYPRAHEDDAERAVRAGLALIKSVDELNESLAAERGVRLAARVGVHTGPVVLSSERGESPQALGDAANRAARIQGAAEPGTLVISGDTQRLVRGVFVGEDLGRRELAGIPEPVSLYRVLHPSGVRSRLDLARDQLTPFVGREQELALLVDRWGQAVEGEGQTVFVSGDAGVGKSRLVLMLRERLAEQAHTWLECRSSSLTPGRAFHPIVELVNQGLAFGPDDAPDVKLRRIENGARRAGFDVAQVVPLLADLLGVPLGADHPPLRLSPELQRERTFQVMVRWVLALAEAQPVLLLVEDLHWCDPSSLELFGRLIAQIATSRVLMVMTARPEFTVPWGEPKNWIALARLRRRQAMEFVRHLPEAARLPEAALAEIVERAGGVPLFLEELTRSALESEQAGRSPAVPSTLQDSLMARLDRLSSAKETASLASVLGREFPYRLLEGVSDLDPVALRWGLDRLVEGGLLFLRGTPPEATYSFRHSLIQEAAYDSLLRSRRREIHARVVRVLEDRFPERVAGEPDLLARHSEGAGLVREAIAYYQIAGERATRRSAHAEAIAHLTKGIELSRMLPAGSERDHQELTLQVAIGPPLLAVRGAGGPGVEAAWARAQELCEAAGDAPELVLAVRGLAVYHYVQGDLAAAEAYGDRVLRLAERAADAFPRLLAHSLLAQLLYFRGRFAESLEHADRALALYDPSRHAAMGHVTGYDEAVVSGAFAAWCLWALGQPDRAVERGQGAIDLARRVEHPLALAHALGWMARTHELRREPEPARRFAEEAIALSTELGFPLYLGMASALRGWALLEGPSPAEGLAEIQQALGQLASSGTLAGAPYFFGLLAEAQWRCGSPDEAQGLLAGLLMPSERPQPFYESVLERMRGDILVEGGDSAQREEAEGCFLRALEVARGQQARSLELRAATSLARLRHVQGRPDEARALLQPIYAAFAEGLDTRDLREAAAVLG